VARCVDKARAKSAETCFREKSKDKVKRITIKEWIANLKFHFQIAELDDQFIIRKTV